MSKVEIPIPTTERYDVETLFPGISAIENAHQLFLTTTPRYERFMSGEPIEEWVGLLGIDVLSLGHGYSTADVAAQFVDCNDKGGFVTSQAEKFVLEVTSRIHDFGEIKDEVGGIGDISHDKKQDEHRRQEAVVFDRLLGLHVPNPFEAGVLQQFYNNIAHGDRNREGLARQFNAIEKVGYLLTAHQAFLGVDGERIKNWKGLAGNVLSNQTVALIGYSDKYPMVQNLLQGLGDDITEMFQATTATPPIIDNEGTLSFDVERLNKAAEAWWEYRAS